MFSVAFPPTFRKAYGTDMCELFRDNYREAYRRAGAKGAVVCLARAVGGVIVQGPQERWQERSEKQAAKRPLSQPYAKRSRALSWFSGAVRHDIRYALRNLRQSPSFSLVAVLTLAIGIGANTAIFSVVNGILLQPLPYEKPKDLVAIYTYFSPESGRDVPQYAVGSPEYFDYLVQNESMQSVAAISTELVTITAGDGDPEMVIGGYVSSSMFSVLKTPPLLGRTLIAEDDGATPTPVFVLGYGLWQRRFGGDPNVIGQVLEVGLELDEVGSSGKIVGVMPEGFAFPTSTTELWTQLPLDRARTWRGGHWFYMIARLAPEVRYEQAEAEMKTMMVNWAKAYPEHHTGHGLYMMPLLDDYVGEIRPALLLLLGAVGFVLLIACANVANLVMARGEARRREIAVRSALGAGRRRIVQLLLTESLILALAGGALGLALSHWGIDSLLALQGGSLPRIELIALDGRVLLYTFAVVILTSLLFGLIPALQAASSDLTCAFKVAGRTATAGRERMVFRRFLSVTEIALAILLVIGAGLMLKSFQQLLREDPGFRTENLLTARISLPSTEYSGERATAFFTRLTDELEALPGVYSATVASRPPLWTDRSRSRFHIEGRPDVTPGEAGFQASPVMSGCGLFETLGIPLKRGRLLDETDRPGAPLAVVIDTTMAERYWPGQDPIGQKIRFARTDGPWHTIVGIVGNARFDGLNKQYPTYYHAFEQTAARADFHARTMTVMVRAQGEPSALAGVFREKVRELDANLPISRMQTMDDILAGEFARPRFLMTLLGVFATAALVLGAIGVYGVMSHGVTQRTNEIGIRMALGAKRGEVSRMVLGQGALLALVGVLVGLGAAYGLTRVLSGFLYKVSTTDPWTFATVSIVMIAVGLLSSYVPARRATRIDPLEALRYE
jgi:predicted permease